MATPPSLRYWLIRIRALNQPLLWCSGLAVVLLVMVFYEHRRHPEWLGRFEVDSNSPGQPSQNSTLTPAEQGSIADIDNLGTLYRDLGVNPVAPDPEATQAIAPPPPKDLLSLLQAPPESGQAGAAQAAAVSASPFSSYLDQYRFLGRTSAQSGRSPSPVSPTGSLLGSASLTQTASSAPPFSTQPVTPPGLSPLQQALQQQYAAAQGEQGSTQPASGMPAGIPGVNGSLPPAILPATLPGTHQTFLRTTPQMSPPPGTTGYVPPTPLSSPNPYGLPTTPSPGSSVTPNLSPITPNQGLNLRGGSSGTGTLPPATGSLYSQPTAPLPPQEPFTVPRPPGSYIGGGYIYTFSDPNGPSN